MNYKPDNKTGNLVVYLIGGDHMVIKNAVIGDMMVHGTFLGDYIWVPLSGIKYIREESES